MTYFEEKDFQSSIEKYFNEVSKLSLDSKFVFDLLSIVQNVQDYDDSVIAYTHNSEKTDDSNCAKEFFYESKLKLYKSLCEFVHEFNS